MGVIVTWIHFLCLIPAEDVGIEPEWLRSSLVLKWKPSLIGDHKVVTLILFQPPSYLHYTINQLYHAKGTWEDALLDPYHLVDAAFEAWYQNTNEQAWKVLGMARDEEIVSLLAIFTTDKSLIRYNRLLFNSQN